METQVEENRTKGKLLLVIFLLVLAVGILLGVVFFRIYEKVTAESTPQSINLEEGVTISPSAYSTLMFRVDKESIIVDMNGKFYYGNPAGTGLKSIITENAQYRVTNDSFFLYNLSEELFEIVEWNDFSDYSKEAILLFYNHHGTVIGSWRQFFEEQNANTVRSYEAMENKMILSSSRLGYDVYSPITPPQQSVASYLMAYDHGFDSFVCDLRFTADSVPVLHHDDDIYTYAKDKEGNSIEQGVAVISTTTYEDLSQYDFGIYKGERYAGTPIMTFSDMLILAKSLGVEIVVELKTEPTEEQTQQVCEMVQRMGMEEYVVWSLEYPLQGQYINRFMPNCRIALESGQFVELYETFLKMKTRNNHLFVRFPHQLQLEDYIDSFLENDIKFSIGTIDTEEELDEWFDRGDIYWQVSVVRSNKINVEAYLQKRARSH